MTHLRLNPFEFRAGIQRLSVRWPITPAGLNPFEFRAGIQRELTTELVRELFVLIPLNSGQVFRDPYKGDITYTYVLIPLNSGQVFRAPSVKKSEQLTRLNPFEFRAGIQSNIPQQAPVPDVLIPLNSGQVFRVPNILTLAEARQS